MEGDFVEVKRLGEVSGLSGTIGSLQFFVLGPPDRFQLSHGAAPLFPAPLGPTISSSILCVTRLIGAEVSLGRHQRPVFTLTARTSFGCGTVTGSIRLPLPRPTVVRGTDQQRLQVSVGPATRSSYEYRRCQERKSNLGP